MKARRRRIARQRRKDERFDMFGLGRSFSDLLSRPAKGWLRRRFRRRSKGDKRARWDAPLDYVTLYAMASQRNTEAPK